MLVRVTEEVYEIGTVLEQEPWLKEVMENVLKMDVIEQMCFSGFLEYLLKMGYSKDQVSE